MFSVRTGSVNTDSLIDIVNKGSVAVSNTWGKTLDGSVPSGKGRYICANELVNSTKTWWDDALRLDRSVLF